MKNMDPKVMAGVMIAVIVLCGIVVLRTIGFGGKPTPPPIMSGGPSGASMALPAAPAGAGAASGGGPSMPMAPGGSMTLPTPPSSR